MSLPQIWTHDKLAADAAAARKNFRRERLDEPLQLYTEFFVKFAPLFNELIERVCSFPTGKPANTSERNLDAMNVKSWARHNAKVWIAQLT